MRETSTVHYEPGDAAWASAECVHAFASPDGPVRWLQTKAPMRGS